MSAGIRAKKVFLPIAVAAVFAAVACNQQKAEVHPLADIRVGAASQVTTALAKYTQHEFTICAHPTNPNELVVGSMYESDDSDHYHDMAYFASHDSGKSWSMILKDPHRADPACVFDADGSVYLADMAIVGGGLDPRGLELHHFKNGQWTTATYGLDHLDRQPYTMYDREWFAIDLTPGPHRGTVYLNAIEYHTTVAADGKLTQLDPEITLFRSTDGGKTLLRSRPLPPWWEDAKELKPTHPGQNGVLSNGTVVHSFMGLNGKVYVAKSTDGGQTLLPARRIGGQGPSSIKEHSSIHFITMLAVDESQSPFRDRVYVVWTEGSTGRDQLWESHSLDTTADSWSAAHPIDDAAAFDLSKLELGPNDCNSAVAVNNAGIVGVSWADRRDTKDRGYWPRFMASLDGGETWTQSVAVTPEPIRYHAPYTWPTAALNGDMLEPEKNRPLRLYVTRPERKPFSEPGDHWGMAADAAGAFHTLWTDDRSGVGQAYTAPITVSGAVHTLEDVTERIRVVAAGRHFDAYTKRAWIDLKITNLSQGPIRGPLLLKLIDPAEEWPPSYMPDPREGEMIAVNADNRWAAHGAVWLFDVQTLQPGESSPVRRLEFSSRTTVEPQFEPVVRVFARK